MKAYAVSSPKPDSSRGHEPVPEVQGCEEVRDRTAVRMLHAMSFVVDLQQLSVIQMIAPKCIMVGRQESEEMDKQGQIKYNDLFKTLEIITCYPTSKTYG